MRKSIYVGLCLVVLGVVGLLVAYQQGTLDGALGTVPFEQQQSVPLEGIKKVKINLGSSDVVLVEGAGEQAEVIASGQVSERLLKDTRLVVKPSGDELRIELEQPKFTIGFNFTSINLRIALPAREWERFELSTGSGAVEADRLQAKELKLESGSGRLELDQVEAQRLQFHLGSGKAVVTANAKQVEGETGSGSIVLNGQAFEELKLETGSGSITVTAEELRGSSRLETGSGDITVLLTQQPESLRVKLYAGSNNLKLGFGGYTYMEETDGELSATYGNGEAELVAKTGSGGISLSPR
ncbi:DUF4097 family beta strand repeat-containing protein [Paenibacillus sp. SYP-B4298]|uniref:DUF4097 family beta strand repeat-containing protein n=1 Tax=Paenibacillus sp. SYP-B4298 TaxID=2996034 RepID=UPI0022DD3D28|nr:DUF4097 family beta strand repeat-containing protein [Paenibacillus sp. SYP-B4298]